LRVEETQQTDEGKKQVQDDKESMYLVATLPLWFNEQLETEMGSAIGKSYFVERGFTKETIDYFQLGY
jgi:DNA primase